VEGAFTTITDTGVTGALLVLSLLAIVGLYRQNQALHREARESDQKNLERMFEAVQLLREIKKTFGRSAA
jgi:hypothetical protein